MSTFNKRFLYYLQLTNPVNFFKSEQKIQMYSNVVERIQKLQESHKDSGKGKLVIKESLKEYVIKAN